MSAKLMETPDTNKLDPWGEQANNVGKRTLQAELALPKEPTQSEMELEEVKKNLQETQQMLQDCEDIIRSCDCCRERWYAVDPTDH